MRNIHAPQRRPVNPIPALIAVAAILLLSVIGVLMSANHVDAGESCGVKHWGKMTEVNGPGWHWNAPIGVSYTCYSTRVQTMENTTEPDKSNANYTDSAVSVTSSDNVPADVMAMTKFRVDPSAIPTIYAVSGASVKEISTRVVQPTVREVIRTVIAGRAMRSVYGSGMQPTSAEIAKLLGPALAAKGITLDSFNLTVVNPSQAFRDSLTNQQQAQEDAKLKASQVEVAKQEAARQEAEAQGAAQVAKTKADSDATVAKTKAQSDAAVTQINADAEANAITTKAEAQAKADAMRGKAATDYPVLVQLAYYDMLSNSAFSIFGLDDVMPIYQVPTGPPTPTPTPAATPTATPAG